MAVHFKMCAVFYIIVQLFMCQLTFSYPYEETSEFLKEWDILEHYFNQEEDLNLEGILNLVLQQNEFTSVPVVAAIVDEIMEQNERIAREMKMIRGITPLEDAFPAVPPLPYNDLGVSTAIPFMGYVPASGKVRIAATFSDIRPLNSYNFPAASTPTPVVNYKNLVINENLLSSGVTTVDKVIPLSRDTVYYNGMVPASGQSVIVGRFDDCAPLNNCNSLTPAFIAPLVISPVWDYPGVITPPLSYPVFIPEAYRNPATATPVAGELEFRGLVPAYGKVTIVANSYYN